MAGNVDAGTDSENNSKVTENGSPKNGDIYKKCANGCPNGLVLSTPVVVVKNGGKPMENGIATKEQMEKFIVADAEKDSKSSPALPTWQSYMTLLILLLANTLNYVDRYTIAGVLIDIQKYYNISNAEAGLLQTSFICSYMVLSPIFGYLGDRCNRKLIMACGILFWSVVTFVGSFVKPDYFLLFLFLRGLVGVGEASYSTIAPTIIADLFVKDTRTVALAIFYFAIPVGSGLGYIVGANVAKAMGEWQWALRVTPALGVICVICILTIVREPPRGASEGGTHLGNTSWLTDLTYLCKNRSFVLSTLGFTCVAFVAGALSLWAPTYMQYSIQAQQDYDEENIVALKFGIITCVAGFLGVAVGSFSAKSLRKYNPRADPLVCAFGLIMCAPFLYFAIILSRTNTKATWALIFIGETFLCLNWAIVTDIVLYVVIPTRRSTAEAFQILLSHALGDAGSPYLIGIMSETVVVKHVDGHVIDKATVAGKFLSLQYALYTCCFICMLGGGFFLICALFIREDRAKTEKAIRGASSDSAEYERMIKEGNINTAIPDSPDADEPARNSIA